MVMEDVTRGRGSNTINKTSINDVRIEGLVILEHLSNSNDFLNLANLSIEHQNAEAQLDKIQKCSEHSDVNNHTTIRDAALAQANRDLDLSFVMRGVTLVTEKLIKPTEAGHWAQFIIQPFKLSNEKFWKQAEKNAINDAYRAAGSVCNKSPL